MNGALLSTYLSHVVNYDKSLKGYLAANVPSSTGNIYPHQWKDEEVAKSVIFQLFIYWIWFFPIFILLALRILWISEKGEIFSYPILRQSLYVTKRFLFYFFERKENNLWTVSIDWIVTLMHFTCKQLNILFTALYLAVHFTLQFVGNSYVKQKKMTSRE
jgi:hypothetical protein